MKKLLIVALTLIALAVFGDLRVAPGLEKDGTQFTADCRCKVIQDDAGKKSLGKTISAPIIINFGDLKTYKAKPPLRPNPQDDTNQGDCESACRTKWKEDPRFKDPTWMCQNIGCPSGQHTLTAYAAVGTRDYISAQSTPNFTCTGGGTICKCPTGWTCNGCSPQVVGGITTDGKCKKVACQSIEITPLPPDGTAVGSWGFTWGNALVAWGTAANGGAPKCATTPCSGHY